MGAPPRPLHSVLIANRGEIVPRIQRTVHNHGMTAGLVYSDVDAQLPYARDLGPHDKGYPLPGSDVVDTYLNMDSILGAARALGCDAIHPGYGLLSEHPEFADACRTNGLTFVGPNSDAMRAVATKLDARGLATRLGVPIVPGEHVIPEDETALHAAAKRVGFPLAAKASAGGGGIGMTVVEGPERLTQAVTTASRMGADFFGDPAVYLERYLPNSRHIEIQVLGDQHGSVYALSERDCSMQRRYQKVLEETPSPAISETQRAEAKAYALSLARSVGYDSAGTVEFIYDLDSGAVYFLEMNARLQVEHGISELVHGLDIVAAQLQAARCEVVQQTWPELPRGHAIEARLYAEDPKKGFPSPGTLTAFSIPESGANVRLDTCYEAGSVVSHYYDPLIAKIMAHGETRDEAKAILRSVLQDSEVEGVKSNLPLLLGALEADEFKSGEYTTKSLEAIRERL